jgi:hypothetical protein
MKCKCDAVVEDTGSEKPKNLEENLSQGHFVHYKSQNGWPAVESYIT